MAELTRADLDRLGDRIEAKVDTLRHDVETASAATHARISDVREDVVRLEARPCPDLKEHIGTYHRRNGDANGRGSYPTVPPDTFRTGSMGMLKLWSLIVGVIAGTAGFLAVIQKLMGG